MYILYESYTDECMNSKDLTMNTKIISRARKNADKLHTIIQILD